MSLSYTSSNANQKVAAIRKVYVRIGTDKWQSLGVIGEGATFSVSGATNPDAVSRNRGTTIDLKLTAKLMQTSTVEMWGMAALCVGVGGVLPDFLIVQADADTSGYTIGYALLLGTQVRATAKLVIPPSAKTNRYIELTLTGNIPIASETAVLSPTVILGDFLAAGTTLANTTFAGFSSGGVNGAWTFVNLDFPSKIYGGGFNSVQIEDARATGQVTLGALKNTNLTLDISGDSDSQLRPMSTWCMASVNYEHTETPNAAELALLATWNRTDINLYVATQDGRNFTFTLATNTQLGSTFDPMSGGKVTDKRTVKGIHDGGFDPALLTTNVIS